MRQKKNGTEFFPWRFQAFQFRWRAGGGTGREGTTTACLFPLARSANTHNRGASPQAEGGGAIALGGSEGTILVREGQGFKKNPMTGLVGGTFVGQKYFPFTRKRTIPLPLPSDGGETPSDFVWASYTRSASGECPFSFRRNGLNNNAVFHLRKDREGGGGWGNQPRLENQQRSKGRKRGKTGGGTSQNTQRGGGVKGVRGGGAFEGPVYFQGTVSYGTGENTWGQGCGALHPV